MPEDCRDAIPDPTVMVRGLRERDISRSSGLIRKDAFLPRRNGKDDDGLSVSQPRADTREQLKARMSRREGFFCTFAAGQARAVAEGNVILDVCPAPTECDPYHALITGVPPQADNRGLATRLAERLAQISGVYDPPEA